MSVGQEADWKDSTPQRFSRVGPTEARRDGGVQGGADVRREEVVGDMGGTGGGTKRENCEAILGAGVGRSSSFFQLAILRFSNLFSFQIFSFV